MDVGRRHSQPQLIQPRGFTLIELLVVIAVIAVLLAIFIPVLGMARERGQRAVCLSNLRQLTMAWILYADDHDGKLVPADPYSGLKAGSRTLEGWLGRAFLFPTSRSALIENPDKGALWRYIKDIDVYRCPRGWRDHLATYSIVSAANGAWMEGTYVPDTGGREYTPVGQRVGGTVLRMTRLTDIVSPGAGQRMVFLDEGYTPTQDFMVHYLCPKWSGYNAPPVHHAEGMTLSMADGHTEHWKWRGRETVTGLPREVMLSRDGRPFADILLVRDYAPQTEEGLYDLQRVQRATWGRLGYACEGLP